MSIAAASRPWNPKSAAEPVAEILAALDAPAVDQATRHELERIYHRRQYFHGDAYGHLVLLIRTVTESEGNEGALIAPVVAAVHAAMRPQWTSKGMAWLEAFDSIRLLSIIDTMRSLEIFRESLLGEYLGVSIKNRLWRIFGPDEPAVVKAKAAPKPPAKVTRVPLIERRIALGLELLALRTKVQWNNAYGRLRKERFADVDDKVAMQAASVARLYGQRPEIYRRVSWQALVELSSPSLPESARRGFEERIISGETVKGNEIARARHSLPNGRPRHKVQSLMAA